MKLVQPQQQPQQQYKYLTEMLQEVQTENEELRGHTQQQRLRIDELISHAADLANQLEDAQTAITLLSRHPVPESNLSEPQIFQSIFPIPGPSTVTVPPLITPPPPPPPLPSQSPHPTRQMGAGEELNYVTTPAPTPRLHQSPLPATSFSSSSGISNLSNRREWRKKPRRLMVHSNSNSSDETSPTEEILQEARQRLRKLEEESEAVDRNYQNFRRHHENLGSTTSLLFQSLLPSYLQYNSSCFGYGSSTPSKPFYSSPAGKSHLPVFHNHLLSDTATTMFPSMYQNERTSHNLAFPVGSGIQFRPQPHGSTSYSHYSGSNNTHNRLSVVPTESRFTLPSTSTGQPRDAVLPEDKVDFIRSKLKGKNDCPRVPMLDSHKLALSKYHNPYHETKTVTFGSPLKTTMIYTSPQVSSIESSAMQSHNNNTLIRVQPDTADRPVTSSVQSLSRNENGVKATSNLQETEGSSLQNFSGTNITDNIEEHNILSSYFTPVIEYEIPIKGSASVEKDVAQCSDSESSRIKKLLPTSNCTSKYHTTLSDNLHPLGTFRIIQTTRGKSVDYDSHPVSSEFGFTSSSIINDSNHGNLSTDRESLIQPCIINEKEIDILSSHGEKISVSGTQIKTTVMHKEADSNVSLTKSSGQKKIQEISSEEALKKSVPDNIFEDSQDPEQMLYSSVEKNISNESHTTPSKDFEELVLVQEIQNSLNIKDHLKSSIGSSHTAVGTSSQMPISSEMASESVTEEESDISISVGDQTKKDESSRDDFW